MPHLIHRHKQLLSGIIIFILCAAGLGLSARPAHAATTLYVSTSGVDSGTCPVATPCLTINYAISQAATGDTINVAAGVYNEAVVVNKGVTLLGAFAATAAGPTCGPTSRGAETIIRPATNNPTNGNLITLQASNITVRGFTLDGDNPTITGGEAINGADSNAARAFSNGDDVSNVWADISNTTIENNIILNLNRYGFVFLGANGSYVVDNNLVNANRIDNMAGLTAAGNSRIGIYILQNAYASFNNNCLTGVRLGFLTASQGTSPSSGTPSALNNTFQVDVDPAFPLRGTAIFHNNQFGGATPFTITGNTITPLINGLGRGIRLTSMLGATSVTMGNNTIDNMRVGYSFWNNWSTAGVTVNGGTLTGNQVGVEYYDCDTSFGVGGAGGAENVKIQNMTIRNSVVAGIRLSDTTFGSCTTSTPLTLTVQNVTVDGGPVGMDFNVEAGQPGALTFNISGSLLKNTTTAAVNLADPDTTTSSTLNLSTSDVINNAAGVLSNVPNTTTITNSLIKNNAGAPWTLSNGTTTVNTSCIYDNGSSAVRSGGATLTANNEWWGAYNGPNPSGFGQTISGFTVSGFQTAPFVAGQAGVPCQGPFAALTLAKTFVPNSVPINGISQLTLTITNPGSNQAISNISLTDTLPSGLTISGAATTPQCGGAISTTANSVSLSNGALASGASCTIQVNVTGATPGLYTNSEANISGFVSA